MLAKVYQFQRNVVLLARNERPRYRLPACWCIGLRRGTETRLKSIWHRLGDACDEREVDPVRYIRWSLSDGSLLLEAVRPIEANRLLQAKRIDAYVESLATEGESIRRQLLVEKDKIERDFRLQRMWGLAVDDAWEAALDSDFENVWPLLRYLLALRLGGKRFRAVATDLENAALRQYHVKPDAYDAILQWFPIPADFRQRAERLFWSEVEECARAMGVP